MHAQANPKKAHSSITEKSQTVGMTHSVFEWTNAGVSPDVSAQLRKKRNYCYEMSCWNLREDAERKKFVQKSPCNMTPRSYSLR
jgi:hypothetical protein